MQEFYLVRVTDLTYAYEGGHEYYIEDKAMFDKFNAEERISDVEVPEEFEDDGAHEWLSADSHTNVVFPIVLLGRTDIWSNC